MVERRTAAEVALFDQRDGEAALRGIAGDDQSVDTAADDEDVERVARERIEIAGHPVGCWVPPFDASLRASRAKSRGRAILSTCRASTLSATTGNTTSTISRSPGIR